MPLPAEHWFDRRKFLMSPFFMNRTLMSCPPMSQMTSTSPKKCIAAIMCATVSTMFTSALDATPRARRRVAGGAEAETSSVAPWSVDALAAARASISFVSSIGLPFESW